MSEPHSQVLPTHRLPARGLPIRVLTRLGALSRRLWVLAALALAADIAWGLLTIHRPFESRAADLAFALACFGPVVLGVGLRVAATAHRLGYEAHRTGAGRRYPQPLLTTGPYSVVRNPRVLGGFLAFAGISALLQDEVILAFNLVLVFLYYLPVVRHEEDRLALLYWSRYFTYAERVSRFLPRPGRWKPSEAPLMWASALRRETPAALGLVAAFCLMAALREVMVGLHGPGGISYDWALAWTVAAGAALLALVVVVALTRVRPDGEGEPTGRDAP